MSVPSPGEQQLPTAATTVKILVLVSLLLAVFSLAQAVADSAAGSGLPSVAGHAVRWGAIALLAVVAVMLLIGMGILAHDAVHRVLYRSPFWNDLVGGLLSALALLPFHANRQFHLAHHAYAHQPGRDPENEMHDRGFLAAIFVGSVLALHLQLRLLADNVRRARDPVYAARVAKDLALLGVAGGFYFALLPALGISPLVSFVPVLVMFPPVFGVRALSDHYGIPAVEAASARGPAAVEELEADPAAWLAERERRQRQVSGWVVRTSPWLEWLWSNVNYHEVHHKYPWLSYHHLPAAFEATRDRHDYRVVEGYWRSLWRLRRLPYYAA